MLSACTVFVSVKITSGDCVVNLVMTGWDTWNTTYWSPDNRRLLPKKRLRNDKNKKWQWSGVYDTDCNKNIEKKQDFIIYTIILCLLTVPEIAGDLSENTHLLYILFIYTILLVVFHCCLFMSSSVWHRKVKKHLFTCAHIHPHNVHTRKHGSVSSEVTKT